MLSIARWLARNVWWGLLWFMRRPTIKRWRRDAPSIFPSKMRERIWRSIVHQDQLARRYGLTMLTVTFTLLMLAVLITLSYLSVLALVDSGALSRPETP